MQYWKSNLKISEESQKGVVYQRQIVLIVLQINSSWKPVQNNSSIMRLRL